MPVRTRNENDSVFFKILSSRLFFIIFFIIAVYLFINVYHQIEKRIKIKREIKSLEAEINNLQSENTKLSSLIEYFQTDEYVEASSREKLGYKKPGETVVVFTKEEADSANKISTDDKTKSNLRLWWEHFVNN